ncbi:uncharacterized protein BDW43DRAFT_263147 [Aspergillus alliaceus]|uniref:uncharacterized protein n=1 Tax=Petromyces alliaceus TaxID=209559 RepID=UPI0012A5DFE3|nr:uncharacterized protein BDW43DRAFT_263147 [Aspergillus alliaceus]KAB8238164.1 hypothetical protein BDW43DRAFT_263147 [Aspergillus alliaceus]
MPHAYSSCFLKGVAGRHYHVLEKETGNLTWLLLFRCTHSFRSRISFIFVLGGGSWGLFSEHLIISLQAYNAFHNNCIHVIPGPSPMMEYIDRDNTLYLNAILY